jgi:pSer/pThr/pTyr-binding forkhead associated (FHA) protein
MKKIVRLVAGEVVADWRLDAIEVLIGRGGDCQIQLNDPSVSRHHAKITRVYSEHFIEDLNSTNGVILNGRRVRKHVLKASDHVQIGTHDLQLVDDEQQPSVDAGATLLLKRPSAPGSVAPPPPRRLNLASPAADPVGPAYLRFLSGPQQGDSRPVDKALYTLGQPGGNLAVISKRAQGYFLLHLGGNAITRLNGHAVHGAGVKLSNRDVIRVGDMEVEFHSEEPQSSPVRA